MRRKHMKGGSSKFYGIGSVILLVILGVTTLPAQATTIDFDSSADLDGFSERIGGPTGQQYTWTDSVGVGSPLGAVAVGNVGSDMNAENLFYTAETFNPADGPLTVSVYFLADDTTTTAISRNFVGFANNAGTNLATGTGKLGVRVFKNGSLTWIFQLQNGTSTTTVGNSFSLTADHWYRMSLTVTATGGTNQYSLAGQLDDCGTDGTSLLLIRSDSGVFTNNELGLDATWNVGLLGQRAGGGAAAFDNLVVPEPACITLIALGGAMMIVRRRNR